MKKLMFLLSFILSVAGLNAQIADTTRAPHGGRLETSGNFKVEVSGCNDYVEVYIYDSKMQPIHNYGVIGDVKFFMPDEVFSSVPLVYYGTDGFTAKIPSADFFYCRVTANVAGQVISAKFDNVCNMSVGR